MADDEGKISGLVAERLYEHLPMIHLLELGGERFDVEDPRLVPDQLLVLVRKEDGVRFSIEIDVIVEQLPALVLSDE